MKLSLRILALSCALIFFVLHIVAEGWNKSAVAESTASGTRPNLLALGLAFWVFGELIGG